jgi:hypothetical protein
VRIDCTAGIGFSDVERGRNPASGGPNRVQAG